jgi:hypothetical protein
MDHEYQTKSAEAKRAEDKRAKDKRAEDERAEEKRISDACGNDEIAWHLSYTFTRID